MEISTKENQLVVKHNKLIESKHAQLTAREKKLLALVMAQIAKDDDTFKLYKIPAHEIKKVLDLDSGDFYKQLKDVASKLDTRRVVVEDLKAKSWQILHFVSTIKYENGYLYIQLHQELAPFLLKLYRDYTAYELKNVLTLNSSHSITIYEWLKKWVKVGKREITIFELKERLGVQESKSYDNFARFNKRVLEPAIKEINEKADLTFHYETKKERQKIVSLIFYIALKDQAGQVENVARASRPIQTEISIEEPEANPLVEKLISDLSPWFNRIQAEAIIYEVNIDERLITSSIKYFYSEQKAGKTINKPEGFIYSAIKRGYCLPSLEEEKKEAERLAKLEEKQRKEQEKNEREAKSKAEGKRAWEEFQSLPEDDKAIIIGQILSSKGNILRNDYKTRGLKSLLLKGEIVAFMKSSWDLK